MNVAARKGFLPLKECKITSDERKKELFEEHYRKREAKRAKELKMGSI